MNEIENVRKILCNKYISPEDINWERFNEIVSRVNIQQIIYDKIKTMEKVPQQILNDYRLDFERVKTINILQCKRLVDILKQFNTNHIEAIVFKGAYLADKVYKKFGLRKMGDVDILIHKNDLNQAVQIITESGFTYKKEHCSKNWFDKHYYRTALYTNGPVEIELHWSLFPVINPLNYKTDDIWATAKESTLYNIAVKEMKMELHLIYLCTHVSYCHFFNHNSIRRLYDIYLIITENQINWSYLTTKSVEYELNKFVGVTLYYINHIFEEIVDPKVINSLIDNKTLKGLTKLVSAEDLFTNEKETDKKKIMETQRLIQLTGMNHKMKYIRMVSTKKSASGKWIAALYDTPPDSMKVLIHNWFFLFKVIPKYVFGGMIK